MPSPLGPDSNRLQAQTVRRMIRKPSRPVGLLNLKKCARLRGVLVTLCILTLLFVHTWMMHPVVVLDPQWAVQFQQGSSNKKNQCRTQYRPVPNPRWDHVVVQQRNTTWPSNKSGSADMLEQPLPRQCGTLRRRDWLSTSTHVTVAPTTHSSSSLTRPTTWHDIAAHQSNCSAPTMRFAVDNQYGLGSHLVLWSQALCNAWEQGYRIQTTVTVTTPPFNDTKNHTKQPQDSSSWLWLDQMHCGTDKALSSSPLSCYFPRAELACPGDRELDPWSLPAVPDPRNRRLFCQRLRPPHPQDNHSTYAIRQFRASSFAYLFQHVSPIVVHEAERQLGLLFPNGHAPADLIAVHIRWGDKFWEMELPSMDEYIHAIDQILEQRQKEPGSDNDNTTTTTRAHIYLATEDPKAVHAFVDASSHRNWSIAVDRTVTELNAYRPPKGNRASWTTRNTRGRAGLVALGSLLVALEAQDFVLTTQSNWSRLIRSLHHQLMGRPSNARSSNNNDRKDSIIIDLRPGEW